MELNQNSQKVELTINRQQDASNEIDLVRVFSNMANKRRIYLPLIAIFLIIGLILPLFLAEFTAQKPNAQAAIQLKSGTGTMSFPSYVLQDALDQTILSEPIRVSSLERNLTVEQLLSAETRQRLEILERQIAANQSSLSNASNISLDYENTYIITLANGFDSADSGKLVYLSSNEIKDLLNNVIAAYNNYLYKTLMDFSLPEVNLDALDVEDLECVERLEVIKEIMSSLKDYCDENQERYPTYRSAANGLSFRDLSQAIELINRIDVNYLYSFVKKEGIAEDPTSLLNKWNYALRNARLSLDEINGRINSNKTTIDNYTNESIALSSTDGQFSQTASVTTEYYNSLVLSQMQLYARKAELEQTITELEDKIDTVGESSYPEMLEYVETEYADVYRDAVGIQQLVVDYASELMESDTVTQGYIVSTSAQAETTGFFSAGNIKKAVIGAVAGVFLGVVIWFVDGFIKEMRTEEEKVRQGERKEAAEREEA